MNDLLIVVFFLITALPGTRQAVFRILKVENEIIARRRRIELAAEGISTRLRGAAAACLASKREIKAMRLQTEAIERETLELRAELVEIMSRRPRARWIMEGSMRGLKGRYAFTVRAADPGKCFGRSLPDWSDQSWRDGREIRVGGLDDGDAFKRLSARFQADAGFEVHPIDKVDDEAA